MVRVSVEELPLIDDLLQAENEPNSFHYGNHSVTVTPNDSAVTALLLLSISISVCGSFAYGCAAGYSSPVESEIEEDLGLSTAEFSLFGSMLTVGGLVGSIFSGKISDIAGRRWAMGLGGFSSLLGWIAIMFSKGAWSLDLGRFFLGVGAGIGVYVAPVYNAEIAPKNLRGGLVLLCQMMICLGISVTFFAGIVTPWRILALIGIIPCLLQFVGIFCIPESPRYLAKIGHTKEFEDALKRLRGNNVDVSIEATEIKVAKSTVLSSHAFFRRTLFSTISIIILCALTASFLCSASGFLGEYRNPSTDFRSKLYTFVSKEVTFGLMALSQFGGANGVLFYASSIFESAGFSSTVGSIGMAIIQLPSTALGVYLMDKTGRRPILMFSAASLSFSCILVALSFVLEENVWLGNMSPYLVVAGIWAYSATYPLGMGGIPFVVMSEVLPMNIKGLAGSLATMVSWTAGWIVTYSFNFMLEWSSAGTFFIIAGVNAFAVLFVAKLVPETKGRTLEEIQVSITPIRQ